MRENLRRKLRSPRAGSMHTNLPGQASADPTEKRRENRELLPLLLLLLLLLLCWRTSRATRMVRRRRREKRERRDEGSEPVDAARLDLIFKCKQIYIVAKAPPWCARQLTGSRRYSATGAAAAARRTSETSSQPRPARPPAGYFFQSSQPAAKAPADSYSLPLLSLSPFLSSQLFEGSSDCERSSLVASLSLVGADAASSHCCKPAHSDS